MLTHVFGLGSDNVAVKVALQASSKVVPACDRLIRDLTGSLLLIFDQPANWHDVDG